MQHAQSADDLFNRCDNSASGCSDAEQREVLDEDDEAAKSSSNAVLGYVVGGAGIAAGVVLLVISSDDDAETATQPSVRPWVGWSSVGITGTF
jgi:hypothetical protein